jgi:hypothetical protein
MLSDNTLLTDNIIIRADKTIVSDNMLPEVKTLCYLITYYLLTCFHIFFLENFTHSSPTPLYFSLPFCIRIPLHIGCRLAAD